MADLSVLADPGVNEFEITYRPRSLLEPIFSEVLVRALVLTWAAGSSDWELVETSFPIIEGVKHLRVRAKRSEVFFQEASAGIAFAASALTAATILGVALFAFLSVREVRVISQEVGPVGFSLLGLAVAGAVVMFFLSGGLSK